MRAFVITIACLFLMAPKSPAQQTRPAARVPVIHCTDLYHPHEDPDDHFDLAAMNAIADLDLRAVILDHGRTQQKRPGRVAVAQMNAITGRDVPCAIGLGRNLKDPSDAVRDDDAEFQKGVELILDTLRQSDRPVAISMVGSARDVAAAFNRDPALFRRKGARLMIFIGEASEQHQDYREWNVKLDPQAYVCLMRSDLPIYWVPCMDGGDMKNDGHASFWVAKHADLLDGCSPRLLQYFIYALDVDRNRPLALGDPLAFLDRPVDAVRRDRLLAGRRNLWCMAIFTALADRVIVPNGDRWICARPDPAGIAKPIFGFSPVEVSITDSAAIKYGPGPGAHRVMCFEVRDKANYARAMTAVSHDLLRTLGNNRP